MEELRFNLHDIDRIVLYGGRVGKRAADVFKELEPDYLISGGMFSMSGIHKGLTVCDTIVDAQIVNGGNYTDKGFAWDDNDVSPEVTSKAKQRGYNYFLGGSPSLVWDGDVNIDGKGFDSYFLNTAKSIRIGMGINDNELIFCFPEEKMKLYEFAGVMVNAGCEFALNLDGGGTTTVMQNQNGKMVALNKRTEDRLISTWLAIYLKQTAKEVDDLSKKVVLDAGHGGADPGAIGSGGTKEKDVTLQIALKTGAILKNHGVSVVYTREKDLATTKKLETSERVSIANKAKADLFVSIHANSFTDKTAKGQETYAYKSGTTGYKLAESIQKELVAASGLRNRGVKTASYYVLLHSSMPAVLVETAFISNPDEEKLLKDSAWQQKTAVAIAKGILNTLGIKYVESAVKNESVASNSNFPESWEWAKSLGITDGSNPTSYAKREHVIEFLYRFAKKLNLI